MLKPDMPVVMSSSDESKHGHPAPVARRFILTPTEPSAGRHARRAPAPAHQGATALVVPDSGVMQNELSAIKTMVGQVLDRQVHAGSSGPPEMPQQLFDMYLELIGQDLSEQLADRIVKAVRQELHQEQWDDSQLVREALVRHLSELVPAADATVPQRSPDDRPLTIALIGPTGVGKTTTLAKLAASFKLRQHRRVGLVTCDTYRIAAVDQLRTYANIIGLPLEIALTPVEMRQAVHALRGCEVVLIDTAGRGPNDRSRLDELRSCLAAVEPHEVHLVLSSTSSQRVLMREAEAFAVLGADRVVLTKLDEAVSFGVLINVMQAVGKKLSFVTTGQEVPDHLEVGRPRRLAELVLGASLHS
ncbi:MAG: flagellar biosynthesis protein FlhF [Planctomycetota bacterium]